MLVFQNLKLQNILVMESVMIMSGYMLSAIVRRFPGYLDIMGMALPDTSAGYPGKFGFSQIINCFCPTIAHTGF